MATEGGHASEYDPSLTPKLRAEAVRVIRGFSFAGGHVVVVGGLVPSLLVPNPEAGVERHIGTQDLDLCLSVALVEGHVGNYDRLEKSLKDAGFQMAREGGQSISWRWRGGADLPLTVEFFCAAGPGRTPGRLHRPGGMVGGKLSALVLSAGRLIDADTREVEIEVDLPAGGGRENPTARQGRRTSGVSCVQSRRVAKARQEQGCLRHCLAARVLAGGTRAIGVGDSRNEYRG